MTDSRRYRSPLGTRYASAEMQALWSDAHRVSLFRRLWLTLAEQERALGIDIPAPALEAMRQHLDDADLDAAAAYERRFRHDVMAHIHHYGDQAPAARPYLHLGATSCFVTDNADCVILRDALRLVEGRLIGVLRSFQTFAAQYRDLPCLAWTHFQPAQLTTVGKRATLWMQDFVLDVEAIRHLLATMRFRGCKGTTGTQASFLELLGGDHDKVRALDRGVTEAMGFARAFAVTGQTYSRKQDAMILDVLSGVAQSAAKLAADVRLLQHEGEILEPFGQEQVGSSAMAYKRNPMRSERISALARFVLSLQANGAHTAAAQWLERTLDDSANRRLTLPEAFLTVDAILVLVSSLADGLEVREPVIARAVERQMPFMATERWLMLGVSAGGDRQTLHEVVRRHSLEVADRVAEGHANDLLQRLGSAQEFAGVPVEQLRAELDPARYVGRAPQQVDEFLSEVVTPVLAAAGSSAPERAEVQL